MKYQERKDVLQTLFQGILYVDGEMLGGANGDEDTIKEARMNGQGITITWHRGRKSTVAWSQIREKTNALLPRPRLVFVHGSRDIGLLFASDAPVAGLEPRKPNSLIGALGWLTPQGFSDSL